MRIVKRLVSELKLPMFSTVDVNGQAIDIRATFQPKSSIKYSHEFIKFAVLAFAIASIPVTIHLAINAYFWIAFLTHWSTIIGTIYLICSFVLSLSSSPFMEDEDENDSEQDSTAITGSPNALTVSAPLSKLTKATWTLFVMNINLQLFVCILYWLLVFKDQELDYARVYEHGVLFVIIAIDGFVLNRTPIRLRQIGLAYIVPVTYLIWTLIHYATGVGNPDQEDEDPETDDDALYGSLNWNERPGASGRLAAMLVVAFIPIMFLFTFGVSLLFPRRYQDGGSGRGQKKQETSVGAGARDAEGGERNRVTLY